ncbi:MAG TPA: hypothetical protein VGV65_13220 [Nocardioides sp.]|nr:hypothetical protein [Nocardioides sp.]
MKTAGSPDTPAENAWALLTHGNVTWRQATEGGAVLTALSVFALTAAAFFKAARVLHRPRS